MATDAIPTRRLIPAAQVAAKLGVHRRSVYRLADEGNIPRGVKVGAVRRWDEAELDAWIAGGCKPPRREAAICHF